MSPVCVWLTSWPPIDVPMFRLVWPPGPTHTFFTSMVPVCRVLMNVQVALSPSFKLKVAVLVPVLVVTVPGVCPDGAVTVQPLKVRA